MDQQFEHFCPQASMHHHFITHHHHVALLYQTHLSSAPIWSQQYLLAFPTYLFHLKKHLVKKQKKCEDKAPDTLSVLAPIVKIPKIEDNKVKRENDKKKHKKPTIKVVVLFICYHHTETKLNYRLIWNIKTNQPCWSGGKILIHCCPGDHIWMNLINSQ